MNREVQDVGRLDVLAEGMDISGDANDLGVEWLADVDDETGADGAAAREEALGHVAANDDGAVSEAVVT